MPGESFVGGAVDATQFASVGVTVHSDVRSSESGLSLQWSTDAQNWDVSTSTQVSPGKGYSTSSGIRAKYFRAVYENGPDEQGSFRLQCIFLPTPQGEAAGGDPSEYISVRLTNGDEYDSGALGEDLSERIDTAIGLLQDILAQSKVANWHLSSMTDEFILDEEFSVEKGL